MHLFPAELNTMLSGDGIPGMTAAPVSEEAAGYDDYKEQEDTENK